MSTREKLIKARMGMLALAEQLSSVSQACKRAGISRSHFYEIKEALERYGAEGLAPQPRRNPRMPNQTPPELEAKILEMTERYPAMSYLRLSSQLKLVGVGVSPAAVRAVWQRHGLTLADRCRNEELNHGVPTELTTIDKWREADAQEREQRPGLGFTRPSHFRAEPRLCKLQMTFFCLSSIGRGSRETLRLLE